MRMDMLSFGQWLGDELDRREMKQAALARAVPTDQGTVSRWISGAEIKAENVRRVAAVLEVDPEALLELAGYGVRAPSEATLARLRVRRTFVPSSRVKTGDKVGLTFVDTRRVPYLDLRLAATAARHVCGDDGDEAVDQWIDVPEGLIPDKSARVVALRVTGTCMAPQYPDGSTIVVAAGGEWHHGDAVVARIGDELHLKYVRWRADAWELVDEHASAPVVVDERSRICGVVLAVGPWRPARRKRWSATS